MWPLLLQSSTLWRHDSERSLGLQQISKQEMYEIAAGAAESGSGGEKGGWIYRFGNGRA